MSGPPRQAPSLIWALRIGGIGCLWLAFAVLMARSYFLGDPPDPGRAGTAAYGHNHAGALAEGLVMTLSEAAAIYLILRPWSYLRSWGRALGALALLAPWTVIAAILSMHAGGVVMLHLLWLLCLDLIVASVALWSGVAALRRRARSRG